MEPIYRAIAKAVRESKRFSLNENSALIDQDLPETCNFYDMCVKIFLQYIFQKKDF